MACLRTYLEESATRETIEVSCPGLFEGTQDSRVEAKATPFAVRSCKKVRIA